MSGMSKDKVINFRASEDVYKDIYRNAKYREMSLSAYVSYWLELVVVAEDWGLVEAVEAISQKTGYSPKTVLQGIVEDAMRKHGVAL
jgi:hypothetical protein